jgi:hypothetical protein
MRYRRRPSHLFTFRRINTVGHESASPFSREYARLVGVPRRAMQPDSDCRSPPRQNLFRENRALRL